MRNTLVSETRCLVLGSAPPLWVVAVPAAFDTVASSVFRRAPMYYVLRTLSRLGSTESSLSALYSPPSPHSSECPISAGTSSRRDSRGWTVMNTPDRARLVTCPRCKAGRGEPCQGRPRKGVAYERKGLHKQRLDVIQRLASQGV